MSRWIRSFLILAVVLVSMPARPAWACSCIMPAPPLESMEMSDAVFSGRVVQVDAPAPRGGVISSADAVAFSFDVDRVWKGEVPAETVVFTARDSASCGFTFEVDGEYLVYAGVEGEAYSTNLCTRTALVANAGEDLAALGEGEAPIAVTSGTADGGIPITWIAGGVALGALALALVLLRRPQGGTPPAA